MQIEPPANHQHVFRADQLGDDFQQPGAKNFHAPRQIGLADGQLGRRADGVFDKSALVGHRRGAVAQVIEHAGPVAFQAALDRLDDRAAADGARRGEGPQDERIAGARHDRPLRADLNELLGAPRKPSGSSR